MSKSPSWFNRLFRSECQRSGCCLFLLLAMVYAYFVGNTIMPVVRLEFRKKCKQ
jgi:hypothetical protein